MDFERIDKKRFLNLTFKLEIDPTNTKREATDRLRFGRNFKVLDIDITARYVATIGGVKKDVYITELTANRDPIKVNIVGTGNYRWMGKDSTDIFSLSKLSAKTGALGIEIEDLELTVTASHEPIDPANPHFTDKIIVEVAFFGFEYEESGSEE